MRSTWWSARITSLFMLLLLAACGGSPTRIAVDSRASGSEPGSAPSSPERKPTVVQKRGGAYYKDDGPGDDIPGNLDDLPDAQPRTEPLHRFANKPYIVLGKSYVPDTRIKPFRQRGIASWYGKKFHGQKTSIGEPYDMFSMSAAHPTLAIPSYARVTSVSSGKSVVVRVIDRGPFHADRVIDLSYAAAHRLGYVNNGSTLVEIEAIMPGNSATQADAQVKSPTASLKPQPPETARDEIEMLATKLAENKTPELPDSLSATVAFSPPPMQLSRKGVFLQLGAFSSADNAENLRSHLSRELDWLSESIQLNASGGMYRVHLGPYATRSDAEKVAEKIGLSLGYKPAFITR